MRSQVIGFIILFCLYGCKKNNEPTKEYGDLEFYVTLVDELNLVTPPQTGSFEVELKNSSKTLNYTFNFTNGNKFIIKDLKYDHYILTIKKNGYALKRDNDLPHLPELQNRYRHYYNLSQPATTLIQSANIQVNYDVDMLLSINYLESPTYYPDVYIFFNTNQLVDSINYFHRYNTGIDKSKKTIYFNLNDFKITHHLNQGDIVYVAIYSSSRFGSMYYDIDLNREVFPCLSTTKIDNLSFVIP